MTSLEFGQRSAPKDPTPKAKAPKAKGEPAAKAAKEAKADNEPTDDLWLRGWVQAKRPHGTAFR